MHHALKTFATTTRERTTRLRCHVTFVHLNVGEPESSKRQEPRQKHNMKIWHLLPISFSDVIAVPNSVTVVDNINY